MMIMGIAVPAVMARFSLPSHPPPRTASRSRHNSCSRPGRRPSPTTTTNSTTPPAQAPTYYATCRSPRPSFPRASTYRLLRSTTGIRHRHVPRLWRGRRCAQLLLRVTLTPVSIPRSRWIDTSSCGSRAPHAERQGRDAGFTLIELLMSIAILGILMSALVGLMFATMSANRQTSHAWMGPEPNSSARSTSDATFRARRDRTARRWRHGPLRPGSAVLEIRGTSYNPVTWRQSRSFATCSARRPWTAS